MSANKKYQQWFVWLILLDDKYHQTYLATDYNTAYLFRPNNFQFITKQSFEFFLQTENREGKSIKFPNKSIHYSK